MADESLLELLYRAYNSPKGIAVTTTSPERLRQKLYAVRKADKDLSCLSFTLSPHDPAGELWIVRK